MTEATGTLPAAAGDDIASLYSHYGIFSATSRYHELVRKESALNAASRWPLLAEFEHIDRPSQGETR